MGRTDRLTGRQRRAVGLYRVMAWCHARGYGRLARLVRAINRTWSGIDIAPGARIGARFSVPSPRGVRIDAGAAFGDDCVVMANVALGPATVGSDDRLAGGPAIGDRVVIATGARILGGVTVGDDAVIAAGAVVLHDVPARHLATGAPARCEPRWSPEPARGGLRVVEHTGATTAGGRSGATGPGTRG